MEVPQDVEIEIRPLSARYVSRGGLKLEGALDDLGLDVSGMTAVDVGSSTGGFTDCLLRRGVVRCYAVDVTPEQLHERLQRDERVRMIKLNARHMTRDSLPEQVDLAVIDCSFISLGLLLGPVASVLKPGGRVLAMIKPQFEAGAKALRRGVVKDEADRQAAIAKIVDLAGQLGFTLLGECDSRVQGPKGNREHFILLEVPENGTSEEVSC
jgi:23S rRNA (cytidine1920-2'-O)/16S rRNA (cytidine1409-2'-O)-methyltransferase